jgi:hypothetical protein
MFCEKRIYQLNVVNLITTLAKYVHCRREQNTPHKSQFPKHLINIFSVILQIIFEAERGNGVGGEIGLDNVVLTSGYCQEEDTPIF